MPPGRHLPRGCPVTTGLRCTGGRWRGRVGRYAFGCCPSLGDGGAGWGGIGGVPLCPCGRLCLYRIRRPPLPAPLPYTPPLGATLANPRRGVVRAAPTHPPRLEEWTLHPDAPPAAVDDAGGSAAAAAATADALGEDRGEGGVRGGGGGGVGVGDGRRRRRRECRRVGLVLAPACHVRRLAVRAHVAAAGGVRELPEGDGVM